MINFLYALLLNEETALSPKYKKVVFPSYLEHIRSIFKITNALTATKAVQLALATELKLYLTEDLKKTTLNFSSGKYVGEETYPIPEIVSMLQRVDLSKLKQEALKNTEESVVNNLYYIFNTHLSGIYKASAILILWALVARDFYL